MLSTLRQMAKDVAEFSAWVKSGAPQIGDAALILFNLALCLTMAITPTLLAAYMWPGWGWALLPVNAVALVWAVSATERAGGRPYLSAKSDRARARSPLRLLQPMTWLFQ